MEINVHEYKLECCAKFFGLPFYLICQEFYKCALANYLMKEEKNVVGQNSLFLQNL